MPPEMPNWRDSRQTRRDEALEPGVLSATGRDSARGSDRPSDQRDEIQPGGVRVRLDLSRPYC